MFSPLTHSIIRTLTWFSLSHYPLTTFECWQYLYSDNKELVTASPREVELALQVLVECGVVKNYDGFWQLADEPAFNINLRFERARLSIIKRRRAWWATKLLAHIPFVRLVALGNSVAFETPNLQSDIDLFIVVAPHRLYTCRFFVTAFLQIMGWRRHGRHFINRLCLSFYVTTDTLNLEPVKKTNDPYLQFWLARLVPWWGSDMYKKFMLANNWVNKFLPNVGRLNKIWGSYAFRGELGIAHFVQHFGEVAWEGVMGDWGEGWLKSGQLRRINKFVSKHKTGRGDVVINNNMIKIHVNDRREVMAKNFNSRLTQVMANML